MKLCVIPARGGSKRIPRKNLKPFLGKPIIAYSIEAAINSAVFDRIIISTDDAEIAEIAIALGGEVPFLRPSELSDDHATTSAVVKHALEWQSAHGEVPDQVCCLYATAPFVQAEALRGALDMLIESGASYVFSVTRFSFPIQRALRVNAIGELEPIQPQFQLTRSQDLEASWHDAGQFYWGTSEAWKAGLPLFSAGARPYPLPSHLVQDIDTHEDWERAELLFRAWKSRGAG